jgi:hypothetical protein
MAPIVYRSCHKINMMHTGMQFNMWSWFVLVSNHLCMIRSRNKPLLGLIRNILLESREFYLSVQVVPVCYGLISESLLSPIP